RDVAVCFVGAQAIQKPEAVDERHPEIEQDGVGADLVELLQSGQRRLRNADVEPFEGERLREGMQGRLVVVDDEKTCGGSGRGSHLDSCTRFSASQREYRGNLHTVAHRVTARVCRWGTPRAVFVSSV